MQMTGNTILITGGGSGIGRGLAEALHKRGNTVIIAGRRKEVLDAVTAENPGMKQAVFDVADAASIRPFVDGLVAEHPGLNMVIHMAGIMRPEQVKDGGVDDAEATVNTNLLGTIRLTAALLPQLLQQPKAAVLTCSSGLAFVPMAATPTYSATKAAVHSYSQSLRHQLKDTSVQVIEIAPPYVQTELMGSWQASDPMAMPLCAYIEETMSLLETQPDAGEILVERVKPLRFAEASGTYDAVFTGINSR